MFAHYLIAIIEYSRVVEPQNKAQTKHNALPFIMAEQKCLNNYVNIVHCIESNRDRRRAEKWSERAKATGCVLAKS